MKSFFRYPGGKNKIKKTIVDKITSIVGNGYFIYREPFFGGGSIGINVMAIYSGLFPNIRSFWINDLDYSLSCLWNNIIYNHKEFNNYINSFEPSVAKFYEYKEILLGDLENYDKVYVGFMKLAIHQMSYSGLGVKAGGPIGGKTQESDYDVACRWSPKHLCSNINKLHDLMSTVDIYNGCTNFDFETLLTTSCSDRCIIYLDPPYFHKGNELYHLGFDNESHERLCFLLKNTEHDWVLSYDDCEEIRDLYHWANIEEVKINYTITSSRNNSELLITKR